MFTLCCFVKKLVLSWITPFCRKFCFVAIYALLCGEKLNQRFHMWRKNDKYEVCPQPTCQFQQQVGWETRLGLARFLTFSFPSTKCISGWRFFADEKEGEVTRNSFPSTFRREHFSYFHKNISFSIDLQTGAFFWSHKNISFSSDFQTWAFLGL